MRLTSVITPAFVCLADNTFNLYLQEEWWEDLAYLIWRDPIAVFVNYFGTSMEAKPAPALPRSDLPASFLNDPSEHGWLNGLSAGGLRRASLLIGGMLRFKKALESNTAAVDTLGRGGALPLCMFQYTRVFATNRTPGVCVCVCLCVCVCVSVFVSVSVCAQ